MRADIGNGNDHVELAGSHRLLPETGEQLIAVRSDQQIIVTVVLRRRAELPVAAPRQAGEVTQENFAERHGADPADVELVRAFADDNGLRVVETNAASRRVKLEGSVGNLQRAFGVQLGSPPSSQGSLRLREGPVQVPSGLADVITGVFGLDNRQQAEPRVRPGRP